MQKTAHLHIVAALTLAAMISKPASAGTNEPPAAAAGHTPDAADPALTELFPASLPTPIGDYPAGALMQTITRFGDVTENCNITESIATCSLTGTGTTRGAAADLAHTALWTYAQNARHEPVLLLTVAGSQEFPTDLKIIHGARAAADIDSDDFLGAMQKGAQIAEPRLIGCRSNCVYGLALTTSSDLLDSMRAGRTIGLQIRQNGDFRRISLHMSNFPAAEARLTTDVKRRL